jgi:hypothetical protein
MTRSIAIASLVATGCLGPQASDTPIVQTMILPAGSTVVSALDDPAVVTQLAVNDGVDDVIARQTAFANGAVVHVWDFGAAPDFAAPLFVIVRRDNNGALTRTPHNTIIEAIPGDPGYSPFWAAFFVEITDRYNGELLTSFAAVEEAVELGLVLPPVAQPFAVNCPIVGANVRVQVADGAPPVGPNATFYYRGKTVPYFDFGVMPLVAGVRVPEAPRYRLRREGQEPLSEIERHVDMDGDGDANDTNDIYPADPRSSTATPRLRAVDVVVPVTTASIDTSMNEASAALRDATQLFSPDPQPDVVISYRVTNEIHNWPGQHMVGGL